MDLDEARAKARLLFPKVSPPADCPLTEYGRREVETKGIRFGAHIGTMTPPGFPLPELLYFGLTKLLDLEDLGTEEKVLWTVHFSIDGATYAFSYRKFGLRFLIEPHNLDTALTKSVLGKARALTDIVENHLATSVAFQQLDAGLFTIESLYQQLDERYWVLRNQAILSYKKPPPGPIETVETSEHGSSRTIERDFDRPQREGGAFATAAVDAYFSRLEHLFCLALAFAPPNIKSADFKSFLASSWSAKMKTLIDIKGSKEAKGFYDKLRDVRAEWRNPIAHGGFLSDGESLYFHLPDVGAVPARMRRTPKGIQFGLQLPHASFEELLELFDGFDTFLAEGPLRYPVRWAATQMSVVFDPVHRKAYREAMSSDEDFEKFIDGMAQALDRSVNMDW